LNKFAIVPHEAIADPELTPSEFKVLVALYSFRDKNCDTVWPKLATLAHRAGYRDATQVSKITSRLESKGWLSKAEKKSFHGPKKYRLTIPDRLLLPEDAAAQDGEYSQLGKTAQVGSSDTGESLQLGKTAQVGKTTPPNLEKLPNFQLGKTAQDDPEHTSTDHTNDHTSSDAIASAARAANPVDNSMRSLGELYQHESAAQYIFDRGVTWLTGYAIPEDQARAFLGMCKEQSGINRLLDALVVSILAAPVQPKPYLMQVLANQPRALDLYWEPDEAQVTDLQAMGVPLPLIKKAREVFVIWFRSMEIQHSDWPRLFRDWVLRDWESADCDQARYRHRLARSAGLQSTETFGEPA